LDIFFIFICVFSNFYTNTLKKRIGEIKWQKESYHLAYSQEKMTYPS
jgi:hypothetical protein